MLSWTEVTYIQLFLGAILLGGLYALVAIGLALIFGVMRILNIAHGDFIILSTYITYWLSQTYGLDPLLTIFLTIPIASLVGFVTYLSVIRGLTKSFEAPIVSSFGILLILQASMLIAWSGDPRSIVTPFTAESLVIGPYLLPLVRLIAFIVSVAALTLLHVFLNKTYFGRAIKAVSQDSEAASTLGIPVSRIQSITFALSVGMAGLAGGLLSLLLSFTPTLGPEYLLKAFVILALSGIGNIPALLVGGLVLSIGETYGSFFLGSGYRNVVAYIILVLILLLKPAGLFRGLKEREV
jgi:branched-chain amino acid transport system permease protein